ncbi:hypothetical protein [uncultured Dubosiella sp.]|uniref:alginate O-acetyltransferase AlgX-related protein n=1 Tax=uncultured Dubosiella sp. TaxID=1937011 RepID=UPI002730DABE|nr:hypothetical protein [uncultured Dubosiella sp.]
MNPTKKKKLRKRSTPGERIVSLCFCVSIVSLGAFTLVRQGLSIFSPAAEKSAVVAGHEMEQAKKEEEKGEGANGMQKFLNGFSENIPGKEEGAKFTTKLTNAFSGNTFIESTRVLLGKDGWLFYKATDDGDPVSDFQGVNRYAESDMAAIAAKLCVERDAIEAKGVQFGILSIPNKASVYPELMPATITRDNDVSRTDELFDYLAKNTDLHVVNAKNSLMDERQNHQLYYSTDTHFNAIGEFVTAMDVLKLFGQPADSLKNVKFNELYNNYAGDLALLCDMQSEFAQDTFYELDPSSENPEAKSTKNVLIIGDSFGERLVNTLDEYYGDVTYVNIWSFTPDMIDELHPDIVLWECAERYTDRLNWVSLI